MTPVSTKTKSAVLTTPATTVPARNRLQRRESAGPPVRHKDWGNACYVTTRFSPKRRTASGKAKSGASCVARPSGGDRGRTGGRLPGADRHPPGPPGTGDRRRCADCSAGGGPPVGGRGWI